MYVDKTNLIRDHVLWGFSSSQLLFALCSSDPFLGNRMLYNFAAMNRRLWKFTVIVHDDLEVWLIQAGLLGLHLLS